MSLICFADGCLAVEGTARSAAAAALAFQDQSGSVRSYIECNNYK